MRLRVTTPARFGQDKSGVITRGVVKGLRSAAHRAKQELARSTQRKAANTGSLARSWLVVPTPRGAVVLNAQVYFGVIEGGRRPGTMPPVDALYIWVKRKLAKEIACEYMQMQTRKRARRKAGSRAKPPAYNRKVWMDKRARSIAFAIAHKIKKKGTKPRWIYRDLTPRLLRQLRREVKHEVKQSIMMSRWGKRHI